MKMNLIVPTLFFIFVTVVQPVKTVAESLVEEYRIIRTHETSKTTRLNQEDTASKAWYKNGAFWFGLWNGYWLPWTYAITLGLDLFEIPPAAQEQFEKFGNGAAVGVGVRLLEFIVAVTVGATYYTTQSALLAQQRMVNNPS